MKVQRKVGPKFRFVGFRTILVGYKETGYLLLKPEDGKLYENGDVRFNERLVFGDKYNENDISNWVNVDMNVSTSDWFTEFEPEIQQNEGKNIESEGVKRKRGRPRKINNEVESLLAD